MASLLALCSEPPSFDLVGAREQQKAGLWPADCLWDEEGLP
jgi:hypothetical protein